MKTFNQFMTEASGPITSDKLMKISEKQFKQIKANILNGATQQGGNNYVKNGKYVFKLSVTKRDGVTYRQYYSHKDHNYPSIWQASDGTYYAEKNRNLDQLIKQMTS